MGEIEDAIVRADQEAFTRQPPKTLKGRINFLLKQLKTTSIGRRSCREVTSAVRRTRWRERAKRAETLASEQTAASRASRLAVGERIVRTVHPPSTRAPGGRARSRLGPGTPAAHERAR